MAAGGLAAGAGFMGSAFGPGVGCRVWPGAAVADVGRAGLCASRAWLGAARVVRQRTGSTGTLPAVPRLIHLNGPPGIGKSVLAQLWAQDHPGVLNLDIELGERQAAPTRK